MSLTRLGKITQALDRGARRELDLAGYDLNTLTLAIADRPGGVVRVHASFDIPADKADALAALVDKHEPVGDGEPSTH